jgi:hypothetical protein
MPQGSAGPLEALDAQAPDAVILDLLQHGSVGMDVLGRIRENSLYTGLTIFVLMAGDLVPETRERLQDLMTIVVPRQDPVGALEELLGVLFPMAEATERRA